VTVVLALSTLGAVGIVFLTVLVIAWRLWEWQRGREAEGRSAEPRIR